MSRGSREKISKEAEGLSFVTCLEDSSNVPAVTTTSAEAGEWDKPVHHNNVVGRSGSLTEGGE